MFWKIPHPCESTQKANRDITGITMIEVLVSITILSATMVSVVSIISLSLSNSVVSKTKLTGTRLTQEGIEYFRKQRAYLGWETFIQQMQAGTYCLASASGQLSDLPRRSCVNEYADPDRKFTREAFATYASTSGEVRLLVEVSTRWLVGSRERVSNSTIELSNILSSSFDAELPAFSPLPTSPVPTPIPSPSPSPVPSPCTQASLKFSPGISTVTLPSDCAYMTVKLWGGAGGSGAHKGYPGPGGPGGYAEVTIPTRPSTSYTMYTATGGKFAGDSSAPRAGGTGYRTGGAGGTQGYSPGSGAGGGGGASAILLATNSSPLAIAGGGGGGSGLYSYTDIGGGAGASGGGWNTLGGGARARTLFSTVSSGNGAAGENALPDNYAGAGGGGGYVGGYGGRQSYYGGSGGRGGTGYCSPTALACTLLSSNAYPSISTPIAPPNATDPDYILSSGNAGRGNILGNGSSGYTIITFSNTPPTPATSSCQLAGRAVYHNVHTANQTFIVPPGCTTLGVKAWGAGGGGGKVGIGGGGGFASGVLSVTPGEQLTVAVGSGGGAGVSYPNIGGYNLGGHSGSRGTAIVGPGGAGGGLVGVFSGATVTQANALLIAGSGGGGSHSGTYGGRGGGLSGGSPVHSHGRAGGPGTQSAGGAAGTSPTKGTNGSALTGGVGDSTHEGGSAYSGGGGGAGYFGGGGGTSDAPGGGGSGFCHPSRVASCLLATASGQLAAQTTDADYQDAVSRVGSVGYGGAANIIGGPGRVVIFPTTPPTPVPSPVPTPSPSPLVVRIDTTPTVTINSPRGSGVSTATCPANHMAVNGFCQSVSSSFPCGVSPTTSYYLQDSFTCLGTCGAEGGGSATFRAVVNCLPYSSLTPPSQNLVQSAQSTIYSPNRSGIMTATCPTNYLSVNGHCSSGGGSWCGVNHSTSYPTEAAFNCVAACGAETGGSTTYRSVTQCLSKSTTGLLKYTATGSAASPNGSSSVTATCPTNQVAVSGYCESISTSFPCSIGYSTAYLTENTHVCTARCGGEDGGRASYRSVVWCMPK